MNTEGPKIRERFLMSSQGERLFTVTIGAALVGVICSMVVGCMAERNRLSMTSPVEALGACNEQPSISVTTYSGTEAEPGRGNTEKLTAVERDRNLVEAVAKCRKDVLDYYAGRRQAEGVN
jgi:hypothetical protein